MDLPFTGEAAAQGTKAAIEISKTKELTETLIFLVIDGELVCFILEDN